MGWADANSGECELATITNEQEWQEALEVIENSKKDLLENESFWFGAFTHGTGDWKLSDGRTPLTFSVWAANKPDN